MRILLEEVKEKMGGDESAHFCYLVASAKIGQTLCAEYNLVVLKWT